MVLATGLLWLALCCFYMACKVYRHGTECFDPWWHTKRGVSIKNGQWIVRERKPRWIFRE